MKFGSIDSLNAFIDSLIEREYGKGYDLADKEEFRIVRDVLIKYKMPVKNFDDNLKTLIIIKENTNEEDNYHLVSGSYKPEKNTINISGGRTDLIHELFHMASNDFSKKSKICGMLENGRNGWFGISVDEGITDYFTSLACEEYNPSYPIEVFFISILVEIFGTEILVNHFNSDSTKFYESFNEYRLQIRNIILQLDNYNRLHYEILKYYENKRKDKKMFIGVSLNPKFQMENDMLVESFINFNNEFVKLLKEKNYDLELYFENLRNIVLRDSMQVFRASIELSIYERVDEIIKAIKNNSLGEQL